MTTSASPRQVYEDPAAARRFENLQRLLECFPTVAELCRATQSNASQLGNMLSDKARVGHRKVGHRFARRVEEALGLPHLSMEETDGIEPHLEQVVEHVRARGYSAAMPGTKPSPRQTAPIPGFVGTLKPLHLATVTALQEALRAGRLTDMQCLNLMQSWLPETPSPLAAGG
jgi:hypothetical protein